MKKLFALTTMCLLAASSLWTTTAQNMQPVRAKKLAANNQGNLKISTRKIAPTKATTKPASRPAPFKVLKKIQCTVLQSKRKHPTAPHKKLREGTSENWSGYAAATNLKNPGISSVSKITGSWNVPHVSPSKGTTYSSIWVGIDGFSSGSVEQIGTAHDWNNGKEEHYAWFEMYPKYPHELVGFPVEPGDIISAEVSYEGNDTFKMTLNNHTKNVTTTVPTSHTINANAKRSSAEWIVEAPASSSGVLPLAHLSDVTLTNCTATINGKSGSIDSNNWSNGRLDMEGKGGTLKAKTSGLTAQGSDFTVQWKHQ
ncbi:MAG: hypothetical protein LLF94_06335 [Chlamydiales bacterium]|nr:hypothetical protein [Chlamydiales bacterium]